MVRAEVLRVFGPGTSVWVDEDFEWDSRGRWKTDKFYRPICALRLVAQRRGYEYALSAWQTPSEANPECTRVRAYRRALENLRRAGDHRTARTWVYGGVRMPQTDLEKPVLIDVPRLAYAGSFV